MGELMTIAMVLGAMYAPVVITALWMKIAP